MNLKNFTAKISGKIEPCKYFLKKFYNFFEIFQYRRRAVMIMLLIINYIAKEKSGRKICKNENYTPRKSFTSQ